MEDIKLRIVNPQEAGLLQQIARQTFVEAFSIYNTEENMKSYLQESLSLERLAQELSTDSSRFYFAMAGEAIIGYLKLNTGQSQTDIKDDKALEIERIYVLQSYHGKKVGQALYEKAIEAARQLGVEYVWLGVWENNHKAIRFYQKNGFTDFDTHIFMLGDDEQTDILMKKALTQAI